MPGKAGFEQCFIQAVAVYIDPRNGSSVSVSGDRLDLNILAKDHIGCELFGSFAKVLFLLGAIYSIKADLLTLAIVQYGNYIAVTDTLRPGVPEVMGTLGEIGIERTVMLTGDNEATAQAVAEAAGVSEVQAGLLPDQKVNAIEALLEEHGTVAMVGDGVNDAPALARATVGIAMGAAGSDTALETSDVALMADDLSKLPFAVQLSRKTRGIIRQNVALSLAIKAVFLALALGGVATLWMAVFADVGASLIVTLNGMRLLRQR